MPAHAAAVRPRSADPVLDQQKRLGRLNHEPSREEGTKRMNSISPRADFNGPHQYVEHIANCLASGHEPFAPATIEDLHAALERWPVFARRWLPSADECERLGIDCAIGQPIEPLSDREQDRLLVTLRDNDVFCAAVRSLILGKVAA